MMKDGKRVLFEGAQGSLLDIDHGTYPYVTSSNSAAFSAGAGVPGHAVGSVLGVVKAYTTRVGTGPFPSELTDSIGDTIRDLGGEYGTTTGRPRRCGWFDAVAAGYAAKVAGPTQLAVMHLDTLAGMSELKVCTAYRIGTHRVTDFPANARTLDEVTPVYETLPGWSEKVDHCRRLADLPENARGYLDFLSRCLDTPVRVVGVGPERDQTIIVSDG